MNKIILTTLSVLVLSLSATSGVSATGQIEIPEEQKKKITLCHRTNSVKNPYVTITVNQSAADGTAGNSGSKPDHFGEHKGPVATSEAVAQGYKDSKTEWGDIIPPIEGKHAGLNWTAEGRAIYNNGCKYVTPVVVPPTPPTPPPVGGSGGGQPVVATSTPSVVAASPQVATVPQAGVNAGNGTTAYAAMAAVVGSLASIGYGAMRIRKFDI